MNPHVDEVTEPSKRLLRADLGFAWGVKETFLSYVRAMPGGFIGCGGGAGVTNTDEFFFPLADVSSAEHVLRLEFRGEVKFIAHQGLMTVTLKDPIINMQAHQAALSVRAGEGQIAIATIELPEMVDDDGVAMWRNATTRLAGNGPEMFGGNYVLGETLAPLTLRVPVDEARAWR